MKVAINGFARMGELGFRADWHNPAYEIVHIKEISAPAATAAHLLDFDSVHGKWDVEATAASECLVVEGRQVSYSSKMYQQDVNWREMGIGLVIDCTGKFKTVEKLSPYFDQDVKNVLVSAPVPEPAVI